MSEGGYKYARVVLDFLRGTSKGEVLKGQRIPGLKYREQERRTYDYLIKNGVVEETPLHYRLTRKYLYGLNTSNTPKADEMSEGQKELLKKFPLVHADKIPKMTIPEVRTRDWTENEGDPKMPGFVHHEETVTIGGLHAARRLHVKSPNSVTQRNINELFNKRLSKRLSKEPENRLRINPTKGLTKHPSKKFFKNTQSRIIVTGNG
jgi:hypothetical protein